MKRFREVALACGAIAALISTSLKVQATSRRLITLDDLFAFHQVSEPQISSDGAWIAYTVKSTDIKNDSANNHIYMTSWDGSRTRKLTNSKDSESSPRFSPDGKYLTFLSSRQSDSEGNQIWLLNLADGQAEKISDFPGGVSDFVWSPDGKRLAVIAEDRSQKKNSQRTKDRTANCH
ncbi:TolB family protein [Nostoc sp.]|uniref:TolB family protein n=1 Tax=Nostoc sp. TaxID=1180 RepID=UPI002FF632DF